MEAQTQGWQTARERARHGKHTVLLGASGEGFGAGSQLLLVRIDCDAGRGPMAAVLEAERRIAAALGDEPEATSLDVAAKRVIAGLRRHLLGEAETPSSRTEPLAGPLARLRRKHPGPVAVLFFAIEMADAASLEYLAGLVRRGAVPVALVFALRVREAVGPVAALVDAVRESAGEESLVACATRPAPELSSSSLAALPAEVRRTLRAAATIGAAFEASLLAELIEAEPIEVLEHLQLARDLGVSLEDRGDGRLAFAPAVLEAVRAHTLPSLAAAWHRRLAALFARTDDEMSAASLRERQGARAGGARSDMAARARAGTRGSSPELRPLAQPPLPHIALPGEPGEPSPERERPTARPSAPRGRPSEPGERAGLGGAGGAGAPAGAPPVGADTPRYPSVAALPPPRPMAGLDPIDGPATPGRAEPALAPAPAPTPTAALGQEIPAPAPSASELFDVPVREIGTGPARTGLPVEQFLRRPADAERGSDAPRFTSVAPPAPRDRSRWLMKEAPRAADHAAAAGDLDTAAALLVRAATEHAARGLPDQALELASRAARLLEEVPKTRARRRLTAQALLEVGRSQTLARDEGQAVRLSEAVKTLDVARAIARELGDAELAADCGQAIAGACYDIGTPETLERALTELTEASRTLLGAGKSLEAARLLNDEAAVWVRLGDPVRAHHLLKKSREVFARLTDQQPSARREMAETDHLLARIVLHAPPRPGRQVDAADVALRHARAAAEAYADLGETRELGRVWETMGRLELLAGRPDQAAPDLVRAIDMQQRSGDVVGLARSTAAFADVMLDRGDIQRALVALADSIALNRDKGARLGLAHNRDALERLARAAEPGSTQIEALRRELAAA
ncbi:MAG: hypothetical protein IT373_17515, partial [Polyangiaceae bacterium]|nr:hypothetical protein [Polyangiaceae bacterium]